MVDKTAALGDLGLALVALGAGDDATFVAAVKALYSRVIAHPVLPGIDGPAIEVDVTGEMRTQAHSLFAFWQQQTGHRQARPTPERIAKIVNRLRDGYSAAEIRKAIEGAGRDPYVSPEGVKFDDIELICRNGAKLEAFIARGEKATGSIVVDTTAGSPLEERIMAARRELVDLKHAGRDTEYKSKAEELMTLLAQRKER